MTRIARILCVALAWLITAPAMADEILPQGRVTNNGDIFVGRYKIGKSRPGKATPDISDQLVTPPQSVATSLAEAVAGRGAYAGWRVQPDKTIQGPDGSRFVARGVTFLDGLFVSYETRSDYRYRTVPGQSTTAGGSTPTGYEASVWGSAALIEARLAAISASGVNLIRIGVEPAISYTAAANGYLSHLEMLDFVVRTADRFGLVAQIQNGNDKVPTPLNVAFMGQLRDRYWSNRNVWINPANEINCAGDGPECSDANVWLAEQAQYVTALRADVTGQPVGTKFRGPIVLNPTLHGSVLNTVASGLTSNTVFSADVNLVLGIHIYRGSEATFAERMSTLQDAWGTYIGTFPMFVDEVGLSSTASVRDPALDPGAPNPSDAATLKANYDWIADFCAWARRMSQETAFSGVTWYDWTFYVPGLGTHDPNSLVRRDGTWTPLGVIVRDNWLAPIVPEITRFASGRLVNLLYNADMSVNARKFAGGAAGNNVGLWDGWFSASAATNVTATNGLVTLNSGAIRQLVRDVSVAATPLTISARDLTAPLAVSIGPQADPGRYQVTIQPARGRGRGATVVVPSTYAQTDLAVTVAPASGAASFRELQIERGYRPTQWDSRPAAIERAISAQHILRIGNPDGSPLMVGQIYGIDANSIGFTVPTTGVQMRANPTATLVGTPNTDFGVVAFGTMQSGFTFQTQSVSRSGLNVVATKTNHGLTAANTPMLQFNGGAILLASE